MNSQNRNSVFKYIKLVCVLWLTLMLVGCIAVNSTLDRGHDEVKAVGAIDRLTKKYAFIDFGQVFPDTYRYDLPENKVYDLIVKQLKLRGETIVKKDRKKGIIYTAAKEAPQLSDTIDTKNKDRIYYQQSIFVTAKGKNTTYVTNYPSVVNGNFKPIVIPLARNMLRGIFFGSLASELYPKLKSQSMKI